MQSSSHCCCMRACVCWRWRPPGGTLTHQWVSQPHDCSPQWGSKVNERAIVTLGNIWVWIMSIQDTDKCSSAAKRQRRQIIVSVVGQPGRRRSKQSSPANMWHWNIRQAENWAFDLHPSWGITRSYQNHGSRSVLGIQEHIKKQWRTSCAVDKSNHIK